MTKHPSVETSYYPMLDHRNSNKNARSLSSHIHLLTWVDVPNMLVNRAPSYVC